LRIQASILFIAGLFAAALSTGSAQNLTEFGAVATGSTVGGASGKAVSNGITAIFGKVDQQTAAAAGNEAKRDKQKEAVELKAASGVASSETGGVPLPPPATGRRQQPSLPIAQITVPREARQLLTLADVTPALPPPPEMSPEKLHGISNGTSRAEVLKFGQPAGRITMFEDGHLVEVYSYHQNGQTFGTLRLTDGAVSGAQ
jgi:hypothetical protein